VKTIDSHSFQIRLAARLLLLPHVCLMLRLIYVWLIECDSDYGRTYFLIRILLHAVNQCGGMTLPRGGATPDEADQCYSSGHNVFRERSVVRQDGSRVILFTLLASALCFPLPSQICLPSYSSSGIKMPHSINGLNHKQIGIKIRRTPNQLPFISSNSH